MLGHKIIDFIVLIGVLIFVHEFGHFIFAKLFKVKVLKFSLGFGPKLFGFRRGETEYVVALVPLGGYVKMLGQEVGEEIAPEDKPRAFNAKPLYQRYFIALAGPAFNLLFPVVLYFAIHVTEGQLPAPVVGSVYLKSEAHNQGVRPGDRIVSINDEKIRTYEQLHEVFTKSPGQALRVVLARGSETVPVTLKPTEVVETNPLGSVEKSGWVGISQWPMGTRVGIANPNSAAGRAGVRTWDEVVAVRAGATGEFQRVERWNELAQFIERAGKEKQGTAIDVVLLRPVKSAFNAAEVMMKVPHVITIRPPDPLEEIVLAFAPAPTEAGGPVKLGSLRGTSVPRASAKAAPKTDIKRGLEMAATMMSLPLIAANQAGLFLDRLLSSATDIARDITFAVARVNLSVQRLLSDYVHLGLEPSELYVHRVMDVGDVVHGLSLTEPSPAAKIGIAPGDRLVAVNGEPLTWWPELQRALRHNPDGDFRVAFIHQGELVERRFKQLVIETKDEFKQEVKRFLLGVSQMGSRVMPAMEPNTERFGRAFRLAFRETAEKIEIMGAGLVALAEGRVSCKTVGGPIMIFDVAGKAAERGIDAFLSMMAIISINLGLLNLLPIPILDGGHILFFTVEALSRRPVSLRFREIASYVGLFLILFLMVLAFKNDIERYWDDFMNVFK
ncbi:MAG: RIP metalloprotease RseP [Deltaproteobacteria bacterium]|nr:RIP metalloprotease RseP [Deltaproteobacteria bacterium]